MLRERLYTWDQVAPRLTQKPEPKMVYINLLSDEAEDLLFIRIGYLKEREPELPTTISYRLYDQHKSTYLLLGETYEHF